MTPEEMAETRERWRHEGRGDRRISLWVKLGNELIGEALFVIRGDELENLRRVMAFACWPAGLQFALEEKELGS